MSTIEIPIDDTRKVHMKRRFRSSLLSRLDEEAPRLTEQLSAINTQPAKRAVLKQTLDDMEVRAGENTMIASMELARTTVEEIDALNRFCADIVESVDGFVDEAGDPVVWKHLDDKARADLFDFDVPNAMKLAIYLHAYQIKAGIADVARLVARATPGEGDDE